MCSEKCSQQQHGRNGTLIVNLGGKRIFRVVATETFGSISKGTTMSFVLTHGSLVVFGVGVNVLVEHEVLPGGLDKRLSLVYEFALYKDKFTSIQDDLEHFDKLYHYFDVPDRVHVSNAVSILL